MTNEATPVHPAKKEWTPERRQAQSRIALKSAATRRTRRQANPLLRREEIEKYSAHPDSPIVRFRERVLMRQSDLAAYLGVTEQTVNNWEAGRHYPSEKRRKAMDALADERGVARIEWI